MISYVSLIEPFSPLKDGKALSNFTSVIELTGGNYAEWNDTGMEKGVPVRFEIYPTNVSFIVKGGQVSRLSIQIFSALLRQEIQS